MTPAPIGLVRIGVDLRVIQANLGYASMVLATADEIASSSISRYFHPDEIARVAHQLSLLATGSIDAVVPESRAVRSVISTTRLALAATADGKADCEPDYLIAMSG